MSGAPPDANVPIEPGKAPAKASDPRRTDGGWIIGRLLVWTGLVVAVGGILLAWTDIVPKLVGPMLVVIGFSDAGLGWFLMKQVGK